MEKDCYFDALYEVPSKNKSLIVKIQLFEKEGVLTFDNGTLFEFHYQSLASIQYFKCTSSVEIRSEQACQGFIRELNNGKWCWESLFEHVENAQFYGSWDPIVLSLFVALIPKIQRISFTYWQCSAMDHIADAICSNDNLEENVKKFEPQLREISMHIAYGQKDQVLAALERLGERCKNNLDRLMLVFEDMFDGNPTDGIYQQLSKLLHPRSEVTLLFGGENSACIGSLVTDHGFEYSHELRLATNELYLDETDTKIYENYHIFSKKEDKCFWYIGSRLGHFNLRPLESFKPLLDTDYPNIEYIRLPVNNNKSLSYPHRDMGHISPTLHRKVVKFHDYIKPEFNESKNIRCGPHNFVVNGTKFESPYFSTIRIHKVIYHTFLTEFLTSNGFYMVLDKLGSEEFLFDTVLTTRRMIFLSTSAARRNIVTAKMGNFLLQASHVEFIGSWYSGVLGNIAEIFTSSLQALTMVQMEIHTKGCLRHFFNLISSDVRENLRVFHFDGRATADQSVASIVNAIYKSSTIVNGDFVKGVMVKIQLDELLIIANTMEDPNFKCRLFKHNEDLMTKILRPGGSATTIVAEVIHNSRLYNARFIYHPFDVMVPICFPLRKTSHYKTQLMMGFKHETGEFNIYMVVPWLKC